VVTVEADTDGSRSGCVRVRWCVGGVGWVGACPGSVSPWLGWSGVDHSAAVKVHWLRGDSCVVAGGGAGPMGGCRRGDRFGVGGEGEPMRAIGGSPLGWGVRRRRCGGGCVASPRGSRRCVWCLPDAGRWPRIRCCPGRRIRLGRTTSRRSPPPRGWLRSGLGSARWRAGRSL
jgi:hypothetical protein